MIQLGNVHNGIKTRIVEISLKVHFSCTMVRITYSLLDLPCLLLVKITRSEDIEVLCKECKGPIN